MNTLFTADSHFQHGNIIKYCNRPWLKPGDIVDGEWVSEEVKWDRTRENDETIIARWNEVVKPGDIVYHLGDFAFADKPSEVEKYVERLNGQIHLIRGNHDKSAVVKARGFAWISGKYQGKMVQIGDQCIFMFHTKCAIWDKAHHGSWHLWAHSHNTLPDDPNSLSLDVGVDCWDYRPIEFEQVKQAMAKKTFKPIDHHGGPKYKIFKDPAIPSGDMLCDLNTGRTIAVNGSSPTV